MHTGSGQGFSTGEGNFGDEKSAVQSVNTSVLATALGQHCAQMFQLLSCIERTLEFILIDLSSLIVDRANPAPCHFPRPCPGIGIRYDWNQQRRAVSSNYSIRRSKAEWNRERRGPLGT
jgi:hypothetical protein